MIKILLAGSNPLFFKALEPLLNKNHIFIVGVCREPLQAMQHYISSGADIIILDITWSREKFTGEDIMKILFKEDDNIKVIAVNNSLDAIMMKRLARAGARGYFYRMMDDILQVMIDCIFEVYNGKKFFTINPALNEKTIF